MENPMGRFIDPTSEEELQRRWDAVREVMREQKIDYLVMQNQEEFMGGSLRWFTDWTARHQFPMSVVFALDEDMTVINCGNEPPLPQGFPPKWGARGIKNSWGDVYFPTHSFSKHYDAKLALDAMKGKPKATIGWVEPTSIPVTFATYLQENLPEATFVDATEWIDQLRARKSPEEIRATKLTAKIQDDCVEHLRQTVKPGMHDYDVYAEVHYFMSKHGSGRGLVLVNSGPMGTFVPFDVYHLQGRVIQNGDQLSVLNETNGPGGLYAEICRIFCVGCEPDQELKDAWAYAVECQHMLAKHMVPGASCERALQHGSGVHGRTWVCSAQPFLCARSGLFARRAAQHPPGRAVGPRRGDEHRGAPGPGQAREGVGELLRQLHRG